MDKEHNCFVIAGNVTLFVEDGSEIDEDEINTIVRDKTKEAMVNDELLSDDNVELKKVKYLEEDDNNNSTNEVTGDRAATGEPPISIVVGASLMALAGLLGFYLVRRQAKTFSGGTKLHDDANEVMLSPNSFIAPDSKDLGKVCTAMDVHECKSALCPRCYDGSNIAFIRTQSNPQQQKSQLNSPHNSDNTMEGGMSSDGSLD